jgi:hypothetical protein
MENERHTKKFLWDRAQNNNLNVILKYKITMDSLHFENIFQNVYGV